MHGEQENVKKENLTYPNLTRGGGGGGGYNGNYFLFTGRWAYTFLAGEGRGVKSEGL